MSYADVIGWHKSYGPRSGLAVGTSGVGVTPKHYSVDGKHFITKLTVNGVLPAVTGSIGVGLLAFTFPAGVHSVKVARIKLALQQADGLITADTPEIGLGSVIASGAVAVLNGTAGFDDILTEQTMTDCDGTETDVTLVMPTAGQIVNEAAGVKAVYINAADAWAGAEAACGVVGEVWLEWVQLSGT